MKRIILVLLTAALTAGSLGGCIVVPGGYGGGYYGGGGYYHGGGGYYHGGGGYYHGH